MKARVIVLQVAAVMALYVAMSMAVALARFPGPEIDGKGGYRNHAAVSIAVEDEIDEVRTEPILP